MNVHSYDASGTDFTSSGVGIKEYASQSLSALLLLSESVLVPSRVLLGLPHLHQSLLRSSTIGLYHFSP